MHVETVFRSVLWIKLMHCAELWLDRARVQHEVKHSEYGILLMEAELERDLLHRESQNFIISFLYKAGKKIAT